MPSRWFMPLAAAAFVATGAASISAQETYDLGQDDRWILVESPDPATPEGRLATARRFIATRNYERAHEIADAWIDEHEETGHPLLPVAYLTRGDALVGMRDEYKALYDYEYIARAFPGSEVFTTALERELQIAKRYARGMNRKLWGIRMIDATDEAEELFIRIQERLPGSNLAEEAGMELGDFYFRGRDMDLAAEAYDLFIENYPNSGELTKARRRLIAAQLASFKGPEFDISGLYDARVRLRQMQALQPAEAEQLGAEALIEGINERDARKMLVTAEWYLDRDDPIAAEYTIRRLVRRYERTAAAAAGLRMIPGILDRLAENVREEVASFYAEKTAAILGEPAGQDTGPTEEADG